MKIRNLRNKYKRVISLLQHFICNPSQTYLLTGYWASYNVPYFEKVYNMSGYPEVVAKMGTDFSYQLAPRAKIFRRDEGKVVDLDSMKHIMRYNGNAILSTLCF